MNVSPRYVAARVGGSQARIAGILGGLARRHEVRQLSQPRLRELRDPHRLRNGAREVANPSLPAALLSEVGELGWPTSPLLSGHGLRVTRRRPLRRLLGWGEVTLVEFPWQFRECAALAGDRPLVYCSHNVEAERFESLADAAGAGLSRKPWLRYVERMERAAVERADLVVAVSEHDRDGFAERYGADPDRIVVAPNAADVEAIVPAGPARRAAARAALGLSDERPVVLFAGADVTPNRRALEWVRAVARLGDDFTFLVVGRVGGEAGREGPIVRTGWIPDFNVALAAADLSLCPVAFGAGTKIKLIESLAAGLPTVVFEESTRGTAMRDGEHVVVARHDAAALLEALRGLAADPERAARMSAAAREHALEHHDWRRSAAVVEDALAEVVPA